MIPFLTYPLLNAGYHVQCRATIANKTEKEGPDLPEYRVKWRETT